MIASVLEEIRPPAQIAALPAILQIHAAFSAVDSFTFPLFDDKLLIIETGIKHHHPRCGRSGHWLDNDSGRMTGR